MKKPPLWFVAAFLLVVGYHELASGSSELTPLNPEQQAIIDHISAKLPADKVAEFRKHCVLGDVPGAVRRGNDKKAGSLPSASDQCAATLVRVAHDHHLPDLYRYAISDSGGDPRLADQLPMVIGKAALDGKDTVPIGNDKNLDIVPSFALDAGFSAAYMKGDRHSAPDADGGHREKLRQIIEACLEEKEDAGTCFSAGYARAGIALAEGK